MGSEYAARYNNVDFTHKLFWTVYGSAVGVGGCRAVFFVILKSCALVQCGLHYFANFYGLI